jgi:proline iminopeptidase
LIYGLSGSIWADFARVFELHPNIKQVLIFGSRAKGAAKPGSDIDFAVLAPGMPDAEFTRLWNELDDLPIVFKLDVLHWDRIGNPRLREKILEEGKPFYPMPEQDPTRTFSRNL